MPRLCNEFAKQILLFLVERTAKPNGKIQFVNKGGL